MFLLTYLRTQLTIDVDSMDPAVAARHAEAARFRDMTSDQAIVYREASRVERRDVFMGAVKEVQASASAELGEEERVERALDILTVLLAKEVIPHITGRVHAQTSPKYAYDTAKTVEHAERLVAAFEAHGIPGERVCIKIPATPESLVACSQLEQRGIRTLATTLFCVPQALAAAQAGCLYVAPYVNELRVHFEPKIRKDYEDLAPEHPAAPLIGKIVKEFKKVSAKTLVMPTSFITAAEAVALAALEPDHLALSGAMLDQLAEAGPASEQPRPHHPEVDVHSAPADAPPSSSEQPSVNATTGFLADGADTLRAALAQDAESGRKLADALKIFGEMEEKTRELVRAALREAAA